MKARFIISALVMLLALTHASAKNIFVIEGPEETYNQVRVVNETSQSETRPPTACTARTTCADSNPPTPTLTASRVAQRWLYRWRKIFPKSGRSTSSIRIFLCLTQ